MEWLSIFTDSSHKRQKKNLNTHFLFIAIATALAGCATTGTGTKQAEVGIPQSAAGGDASLLSMRQGLQYVREHPAEREDERIQRYLWLDQWIKTLEDKGRMTAEMNQEYWNDLTIFIRDPLIMSENGLQKLTTGSQSKLGKNIAYYQLYQAQLKDQPLDTALKNLENVEEDGTTDLYSKSQGLLQLFKNKDVSDSKKIGVLLPLTGDLKPLAEEVLYAIQVASNLNYASGIEFVVEDTGTTDAELQRAWEKLALQERVAAILGPLTSKESEAVFQRAQIMSLPVVSLAPKEHLESFGDYGFRSILTIEDQTRKIANFAADSMHAKRVAILMPDSPYGWDVVESAKKEFEGRGLEVANIQLYKAGATDFKDALKRMVRLDVPKLRKDEVCPKETSEAAKAAKPNAEGEQAKDSAQSPEACVKKIGDLRPLVDFDILFAPDSAEAAGFLMPTLPYLRLYGVQVFGLSLYNSPKLIERAGDSAEGVIFTDGYYPNAKDFQTRFFKERFAALANKEPSRLAAEAFDLAMVMLNIMHDAQGLITRDVFVDRLRSVKNFPGVTGSIYYESQKLKKEPKLLIVRNGEFQELR